MKDRDFIIKIRMIRKEILNDAAKRVKQVEQELVKAKAELNEAQQRVIALPNPNDFELDSLYNM